MWSYIARRLMQSVLIISVVATVTFILLHLAPGDACSHLGEGRAVEPEIIDRCRRNLGLDKPIVVQYVLFFRNLLQGDLGYSSGSLGQPAADVILGVLPRTLLLAGAALFIDFAIGIAAGTYQSAHYNTRTDRIITTITVVFFSVPVFWLGLVLILLIAEPIGWIPAVGFTTPVIYESLSPIGKVLDILRHLMLPALTLGIVSAAFTARHHRAAMLETITADFIRTARAKGLTERLVLWRHTMRNALLPVITLFGLSLPVLLSGAVLVESVFGWNGMGWVTLQGILRRDYHVVTGAAILAAAMVVVGNLVADVLYWLADPRTRSEA